MCTRLRVSVCVCVCACARSPVSNAAASSRSVGLSLLRVFPARLRLRFLLHYCSRNSAVVSNAAYISCRIGEDRTCIDHKTDRRAQTHPVDPILTEEHFCGSSRVLFVKVIVWIFLPIDNYQRRDKSLVILKINDH